LKNSIQVFLSDKDPDHLPSKHLKKMGEDHYISLKQRNFRDELTRDQHSQPI
jgi:hypothetical protein